MGLLYNLARMTTATTGTGTITLGSAVSGLLTFDQAQVPDGAVVSYTIKDGSSSEMGIGTYTASGTTLSRDTVLRSTNSTGTYTGKINLSGSAEVMITPTAEDLANKTVSATQTFTGPISVGTSNAITAGSIELGHASANTLTGSSGDLLIEGTIVKKVGKETIWLPAASFIARATSAAGTSTYDSGSNDWTAKTWDFDQTTSEYIRSIPFAPPKSWNASTLTAILYWTTAGGSSTQTVRFTVAGVAISNDDTLNATMGTAVNVDDTFLASDDLHITAESSAITLAGSPAKADLVMIEVGRDASNTAGGGDITADCRFLGMWLHFTTDASTDA